MPSRPNRVCGSRLAACLAVLVPVAAASSETDVIEWDPTRRLDWSDFVGPVPAGTDTRRVAATAGSLAWSYRFTVRWSRNECTFIIDSIESRALFHPEDSWVRQGHRTDAVLQHEQLHFDILQLHKQKFDAETREFVGSDWPCAGRSERRASRHTQDEIDRLVGSVYERIWNEYRGRQETYDSETQHGTDAEKQSEWTQQLETLLPATRAR